MLWPKQAFLRCKLRRGSVALLVALCLVGFVGVAAIALDGGVLVDKRRHVQAAADAAALAAAVDMYQTYPKNSGMDVLKTAYQSALTTAAAMGFTNDGANSVVTVNIPPLSGPFISQAGYAEVIVQWNQNRSFSKIFGSGTIPVTARAVAAGKWAPFNNGIIVLHPTAPQALYANGNGTTRVQGANIIVDSNNTQAAVTVGNSVVSDAGKTVAITGSNPGYSGNFQGTVLTGQQPTPDPLAYLPAPDPSTMTTQSNPGGTTVTLYPGRYLGGLTFAGQQSVTMQPGIYYMDGGSFSFSGQGNLSATGVMIYSTQGISITGQGTVTWSPPTSGIYTGISYFQSRTSTTTSLITGNGKFNITGTMYVPDALIQLQGNGDASIASQVVALLMSSGGNGTTNIVWNGPPSGRMRVMQLVE
jgi:Flp pilus assembly protein TadG